jgi:sugar phosphate isomerase/epimerase
LATTSFIYPAGYAENVRRLAPWVDEIELLLLERDNLPEKKEVLELQMIANDLNLTYNVHLPMDISLGETDIAQRNQSLTALSRTIDRVAPLTPTTHTIHLTYNEMEQNTASVAAWQERCIGSLHDLLQKTTIDPKHLSVETLDFNPQWLAKIVNTLDLSICIDVGHLMRYGYDLKAAIALYHMRTAIYHLHGVEGGKDHLSLACLDTDIRSIIAHTLESFRGTVSLEVFCHQHFTDSLDSLSALIPCAMPSRQMDETAE